MKKLAIILVLLLCLAGCTEDDKPENANLRLNEELLEMLNKPDNSVEPTVARTETSEVDSFGQYDVNYYSQDGFLLGFDRYWAKNDVLMFKYRNYYRSGYCYKQTHVYNRDFYDHLAEYGADDQSYSDYVEVTQYNGETNSVGMRPTYTKYTLADGGYGNYTVLLNEEGKEYQAEVSVYDVNGQLLSYWEKNPDGTNKYHEQRDVQEDGRVFHSFYYYSEGRAERIEYQNGQEIYRSEWKIDGQGNPI